LLRRMPEDRMRAVISMHRDMNFTMIRNWIGSSTREEFHQACDENGILVWNEFWEAGPFTGDLPGYVDIACDTIVRYRTHPCIVIWCGANEQHPPPAIDAGIGAAVREQDDEIPYLPDAIVLSVDEKSQIQALDRGSFGSVEDLTPAIRRFIDSWNDRCQPSTWTKTADDILNHATPGQRTSFTRH
jgi:beta-galactosidase/beta-glucuronidase